MNLLSESLFFRKKCRNSVRLRNFTFYNTHQIFSTGTTLFENPGSGSESREQKISRSLQ
ncbi:hypothetical protein LEP1GSC021_1494 [Leptospira noguchii str. 1993005606]|nr:hypothetical protein LEP1GSC041_1679 [Leptospira noguchii str. 2006001870]EMS86194.1 hypothetical protein LEP1GSC073_2125 [Leptospira noguchii str. Cascata]EPE83128.1 hypothetical protein LEP1GSC021_1494 [Leptospira noguchii str. 1993005606]